MSSKNTQVVEQTTSQITHPLKKDFIEFYKKSHGHISDSAKATGISRRTFYDWINNDELFRNTVLEADDELNDEMRKALIDKAGSGDLGAIIFYLRKRHPDFKDNYNFQQSNTQVNIALPNWANEND